MLTETAFPLMSMFRCLDVVYLLIRHKLFLFLFPAARCFTRTHIKSFCLILSKLRMQNAVTTELGAFIVRPLFWNKFLTSLFTFNVVFLQS